MSLSFSLPYWYDLHTHLRQEDLLPHTIQAQLDMACCGVLAMPNTRPPTAKVLQSDPLPYWSIQQYLDMINVAGGHAFDDVIVPLYLTQNTTTKMIEEGAKSGFLRAAKYYPPHGTTGADFSYPFAELVKKDIVKALADNDVVLCVHGEEHDIDTEDYIDQHTNAESVFYLERMPAIVDAFPNLRIVAEHITTKEAVDFVEQAGGNVSASITPQHLIYTLGHLIRGLKYHLYCLPLVKFTEDRAALRRAATNPNNQQFFAGTDNAPHTTKATECGCAAGCFTGGIAPQLYAEAFEMAGVDLSAAQGQHTLRRFLCDIGANFYGLPTSTKQFTLTKTPQTIHKLSTASGDITPLPLGMGRENINWTLSL